MTEISKALRRGIKGIGKGFKKAYRTKQEEKKLEKELFKEAYKKKREKVIRERAEKKADIFARREEIRRKNIKQFAKKMAMATNNYAKRKPEPIPRPIIGYERNGKTERAIKAAEKKQQTYGEFSRGFFFGGGEMPRSRFDQPTNNKKKKKKAKKEYDELSHGRMFFGD